MDTCKSHPKYKAIRQPRVLCEACWRMYIVAQNIRDAQTRPYSAAEDIGACYDKWK